MFGVTMRATFVAAAIPGFAFAQGPLVPPVLPADSARIVQLVRAAQIGFEAFRRHRLPEQPGGGADRCDARIGRYCYWRGDDDDERAPPEAPAVRERRDELLALLDTAARAISGDGWVAGQNVRYLVEARRIDDALRFARHDCRAASSWCTALAGFAAHSGGRFAAADSEFSEALSAMDDTERAHWLDIGSLLSDELADRFSHLALGQRAAYARRVLWLGAPLFSISSTDLLTEHLARVTRARIAERSATPDGSAWADDVREVMVRYGWPAWYSQSRPDLGSMREPTVTGHDDGMPYDFLPSLRVVEHVGLAGRDDWKLDDRQAATGYAPRYARSVHDVPHQIALFRRGESTLVVGAWDARRDTTLIGRSLDAALVLTSDIDHATIARASNAKSAGRISTIGIIDSGLVSLELLAVSDRRAARARVGVSARHAGQVAVSDLLLYTPTAEPPYALEPVRDSALTSEVIPPSRAAGVYWETYGLAPGGEPVHFMLTVEQVELGFLRRVAETLRFADPTTALRIQWDEVPRQTNSIAGRGIRLDFSQLRSGRYRMQLRVATTGGGTATAERTIEIR